jgi:hypothetical protein
MVLSVDLHYFLGEILLFLSSLSLPLYVNKYIGIAQVLSKCMKYHENLRQIHAMTYANEKIQNNLKIQYGDMIKSNNILLNNNENSLFSVTEKIATQCQNIQFIIESFIIKNEFVLNLFISHRNKNLDNNINNGNDDNCINNKSNSVSLSTHTLIDTTLSLTYTKNDIKPSNHNNTENDSKPLSNYLSPKSHDSSKYTKIDSKLLYDTNYDILSSSTPFKIDKNVENVLLFENKTINLFVENSVSNNIDIPIEFSYKDIHGILILHCKKNSKIEKSEKNESIFDNNNENSDLDTNELYAIHTILKSLGKSIYDLYRGERKKRFMIVQRDKIASQK